MPWNLTIMEWSQRPLAVSQFKCQLFIANTDSARYSNFHLCLLLNMRIFVVEFYSKVGTMINVKGNYKFEMTLRDWMTVLSPTVTQLCMGTPLPFEVRILNQNIPADAWHQNGSWQDCVATKQIVASDLPTCLWPCSQISFSAEVLLLWSWQLKKGSDQ